MKFVPVPSEFFAPTSRVMFVFAHQDDEVACAGLIQRAPLASRFLWVTNGDGLAEQAGMAKSDYAAARRIETEAAMRALGVETNRLRFLGHSEVEIYHALVKVAREPLRRHEAFTFFRGIAAQIAAEIRAFRPDMVFTLAWQGGHPEHDLIHFMVWLALREMHGVKFFEVPEYELAWTLLLRFPPWKKGEGFEVRLTKEELAKKLLALGMYPTQEKLLRALAWVLRFRGLVERTGWDIEAVLSREFFAPVPQDLDYTKPPHGVDFLEYIGEECEGTRISFRQTVLPVVQALI